MPDKTFRGMIAEALSNIKEVDIDQAEKLMAQGYRILDVREPISLYISQQVVVR